MGSRDEIEYGCGFLMGRFLSVFLAVLAGLYIGSELNWFHLCP